MFSLLRNRFGVPGVIAVAALVFAMVGGAYAAKKYVITSTNQIKPSVLKSLKGQTGPAGVAGTPGAAGAKGDPGAKGTDGVSVTSTGASGAECPAGGTKFTSASGTGKVCNGEEGLEGPAGPAGSPWTVSGTLPPTKTETGGWAFGATSKNAFVPISFPIPLAGALNATQVHYLNAAGKEITMNEDEEIFEVTSTKCLGTAATPSAVAGNLCVYTGFKSPGALIVSQFILTLTSASGPFVATGASTSGARILASITSESNGWGTWAVTAP